MNELDKILLNCLELIFKTHKDSTDLQHADLGLVAACLITKNHPPIYSLSDKHVNGEATHAERYVIRKFTDLYGDLPEDVILVTTLSPCSKKMKDREGNDCSRLVEISGIRKVYTGLLDWSQEDLDHYKHTDYTIIETKDPEIKNLCNGLLELILKLIEE